MCAGQITRNDTFAVGNDPANIQVASPPADAKTLELLRPGDRALDRGVTRTADHRPSSSGPARQRFRSGNTDGNQARRQ
jgi:hypothetical protein